MAVFKCKMCGGALEVNNETVATCTYCGTCQTLPRLDNEKKLALFSRANNLRIKSEFDKAAGIYESIIAEFRDEAEAYWGLVLCKYGIEYVDDGKGKKIPTCHRTLPTAIMDDDDFQQACEYAEITAKNIYRDEAKAIDKIQKKILDIALSEDPYDIFICYKETDDVTGTRTEDSLIAQDIYAQLLKDGYRVFFARVSLREVAGTEYEPYIYAALSSAKLMLAIGTKHEYYDAVWVKNEWSRFISMMGDDTSKVLIPCYRDMDAYDMPKEFKNMQALDMGEVTFFGSLMDSIERIVDKTRVKAVKETIVLNNDTSDIAPLLERGFMFLEDNDWQKADEFFEAVLNKDPKNGNAYLGKLLADLEVSRFENLSNFYTSFSGNKNYDKIMRFGNSELKESVKKCNEIIIRRNEEARKKDIYDKALQMMEHATTEQMFENAGYMFQEVKDYLDAKEKSEECFEKGEIARIKAEEDEKDKIYKQACAVLDAARIRVIKPDDLANAVAKLENLNGWRDSESMILKGREIIKEMEAKLEAERLEKERREEEYRLEQQRKHKKDVKIICTTIIVTIVLLLVALLSVIYIIPSVKYNQAVDLMEAGKYQEAIKAFEELDGYDDSLRKIDECNEAIIDKSYNDACALMEAGDYDAAIATFESLGDYRNSQAFIIRCGHEKLQLRYDEAIKLQDSGDIVGAYEAFVALGDFRDSAEIAESIYGEYLSENFKQAVVGDCITLGLYEQDCDFSNGEEKIEWIVLDVRDGKALVISKFALDAKAYNDEIGSVTWETCSLRRWLNEDFFDSAFSATEQELILETTVVAEKNMEYGTEAGNDTEDEIFLLSITEARNYFSWDQENTQESLIKKICEPTQYAIYQDCWVGEGNACWWWLRSPGETQSAAAGVLPNGYVVAYGDYAGNTVRAVRPAMWINLEP